MNFLIPKETDSIIKRYSLFFIATLLFTFISYMASFFLFTLQTGLMTIFFTSFLLIPVVEKILEKNKNDIWQKRLTPLQANCDMIFSLITIFATVVICFIALVMTLPDHTVEQIFFSQFHDTMTHTHLLNTSFKAILLKRCGEFFIFFIVSIIFRVGSIFVLVWLASVWGVVYGMYIKHGFELGMPSLKHYAIILGFTGVVVFFIRTLSFITASMSGIFLSKALEKYDAKSKEYKQVLKAVLTILLISIGILALAVIWEYRIYGA